jgi:hypothetical protein
MGLKIFKKTLKPKDLLYRDFPYKVLITGYTSIGDDLCLADLIAYDAFGHQDGNCIFSEFNCYSGRCPDHPKVDSKDPELVLYLLFIYLLAN